MTAVFASVLGLHWLGLAAILVGYVLSLRTQVISPVMVWGARAQLILGFALVVVAEVAATEKLSGAWIGAKMAIAFVVVGLCEMSSTRAKHGDNKPLLTHIAVAATALNVVVALTRG
jgi:hypothetical protein